jgi:hypothetical protein
MKDLYHDFRATTVVKPVAITSSANGTGTDLLGYEGALMIATTGAGTALHGASNYATIQFLESSNNVVFSAISDNNLVGGNNTEVLDANGEFNSTVQRGYIGDARYLTITFANTGAVAYTGAALIIKGFPIHAPIA